MVAARRVCDLEVEVEALEDRRSIAELEREAVPADREWLRNEPLDSTIRTGGPFADEPLLAAFDPEDADADPGGGYAGFDVENVRRQCRLGGGHVDSRAYWCANQMFPGPA